MCFYASLTFRKVVGEKLFGATFRRGDEWNPLYFISGFEHPKLPIIAAEKRDEFQLMSWGLVPSFIEDEEQAAKICNLTLNAKAETLPQKPSYRNLTKKQRCIIPITGFFEWQQEGRKKIPFFIFPKANPILPLAGLYDQWTNPESGRVHQSFSIITTEANALMAQIHNFKHRMPAVLSMEAMDEWLDSSTQEKNALALLNPAEEGMLEAHQINPDLLASGKNRNIPKIIEPYRPQQGRLFE
ncbi:MAG TPA: SOS response-associated peptidase [Williamwhitmania sp.]|nr:SOS response-associated peptidase [Williamwhitmania sp.]